MPPSWAMAMARRASVTVSIAAETIGRFRRMPRVSRVERRDVLGQDDRMRGNEGDVVERQRFGLDAQHGRLRGSGSG